MRATPSLGPTSLAPAGDCTAYISHMVSGMDLTGLRQYAARVVPLHFRWVFHDEVEFRQATIVDEALAKMTESGGFNPQVNYLVLNGDPLISASLVWTLAKRFDRVTLLRYDRRAGGYFPFQLTSEGITGERSGYEHIESARPGPPASVPGGGGAHHRRDRRAGDRALHGNKQGVG